MSCGAEGGLSWGMVVVEEQDAQTNQQTTSMCVQHVEGAKQLRHIEYLFVFYIKVLVVQWLIVQSL